MSEVKNRIYSYIKKKGMTVRDFERGATLSNGYVSSIRKGIGTESLKKILEHHTDINRDWLLYGEGPMLTPAHAEPHPEDEVTLSLPTGWVNVPVVPVTAQAGYALGYEDPEYMEQLERMPFLLDAEFCGRYVCFEVAGDSMDDGTSDAILAGDYVLAREVPEYLWRDYEISCKMSSAFVIVTRKHGVVIKRIARHDHEAHIIYLHSLNPLFKDYSISLEEVLELYTVEQIRRKAR